ncbi:unnamed protein product [Euphydryas editha]|uniref:Uncharacterized protein n=1 Tax=Euphydryas editha TaxID=104508 RepID=A0AAU9TT78_EUPED|nr:unnamed protein product [Euphydryas editha]
MCCDAVISIFFILVLQTIYTQNITEYEFPEITIQALKLKGFRAYIPALQYPGYFTDSSNSQKTGCIPTISRVPGRVVCAGHTIFEDDFDVLREDLWQIDHYFPEDHLEHPFMSYQWPPTNPTIEVKDGTLRIQPVLQQDLPGFNNMSLFSEQLSLGD